MASKQAIKQVLAVLAANWPDHINKLDETQVSALRQLYEQALADIPDDLLRSAAVRHISVSPWFPKVAELRAAAAALALPVQRDGMEAWGDVTREMRRTGLYGKPQFDDPITTRIVRDMGWRDLCLSEQGVADRARFIDAYERISKRQAAQESLPPGLQDGAMSRPSLQAPEDRQAATHRLLQQVASSKAVS